MPKFNKGDICKVVGTTKGDIFKIGEIVIVQENHHFPFCKSAIHEEKTIFAMVEDKLEPLQGSELEAFLNECPEYRKESVQVPVQDGVQDEKCEHGNDRNSCIG